MSDQTKLYTDEQLSRVTDIVQPALRMSREAAQAYARYLMEERKFALIGYGSLMGDALKDGYIRDFFGTAQNWKLGAKAIECYVRGIYPGAWPGTEHDTEISMHLTATAEPAQGESLDGLVQLYWEGNPNEQLSEADIERIGKVLGGYSDRESGPTHRLTATYSFDPIWIEPAPTSSERRLQAIICAADKTRPNYVPIIGGQNYDVASHLANPSEQITLLDAAASVAMAYGLPRVPRRATGREYWLYVTSRRFLSGAKVSEEMYEGFIKPMNAIRYGIVQAVKQNHANLTPAISHAYNRIVALEGREAAMAEASELDGRALAMPGGKLITPGQCIELVTLGTNKLKAHWERELEAHLGPKRPGQLGPLMTHDCA